MALDEETELAKKRQKFDRLRQRMLHFASRSLSHKKNELSLSALAFLARITYLYNQVYTDDDLENLLESNFLSLGSACFDTLFEEQNENRVVFYDGFGLDLRGVCPMYLNALSKGGFEVLYIAPSSKKDHLPRTLSLCEKCGISVFFFEDRGGYLRWMEEVFRAINRFAPKAALFYTTPFDVSGALAFRRFQGKVDRYLIDLTDHAFWIGKNACDYFCGSREMSAYIQLNLRRLPKEKLIKLGVNLLISEESNHDGLPFDPKKTRYVFSGGSLYKTLGDPEDTYYRLVRHILTADPTVLFLYAGGGDKSKFEEIQSDYPDRVFVIDERSDYFYLIQNCVFYLNTYPMFGGMMMKYCALAKKLPLTLKHNNDSDGLLLHQEECAIEYSNYEELAEDIERLLSDPEYLKRREARLEGSVITEERFVGNVKSMIRHHVTDYEHEFKSFDVSTFQREFAERFNFDQAVFDSLSINDARLSLHFPKVLIKKVKRKFKRR